MIVGEKRILLQMDERTCSFRLKRLLYYFWCTLLSTAVILLNLTDSALALLCRPSRHLSGNQVLNWHLGVRKNLHSHRIRALRLRTRIIIIFSFGRVPDSKALSFSIFFMIPKESGQNKLEQYKNYRNNLYIIE